MVRMVCVSGCTDRDVREIFPMKSSSAQVAKPEADQGQELLKLRWHVYLLMGLQEKIDEIIQETSWVQSHRWLDVFSKVYTQVELWAVAI